MKVVHLSNTNSGGAVELHAAMLGSGIDSVMLVKGFDAGVKKNIYKISNFQRYKSNLGNLASRIILPPRRKELSLFSIPFLGASLHKNLHVISADIIYLHFVAHSSFLSFKGIKNLLQLGKPVVFVTRDMWPMTGGCHSFLECQQFTTNCGACPHYENTKPFFNWPKIQLNLKKRLFDKFQNLYFLAISNANQSELNKGYATSKCKSYSIGNAIDMSVFKIKDKDNCRKLLGISSNKIVIGFGARNTNNPLKGYQYLEFALEKLSTESDIDFQIVSFGDRVFDSHKDSIHLGYIKDREKLSNFYNAVDLYISPSLTETFGNTVAESMACGTPVVGFDIGGLKDIIDHRINGYLAKFKDEDDLAKGISFMLNMGRENQEIGSICRRKIDENFSYQSVLNAHKAMIKEIQNEMN